MNFFTELVISASIYVSCRAFYHYFVKPIIDRDRSFNSAMNALRALKENERTYLETFTVSNGQFNNGDH